MSHLGYQLESEIEDFFLSFTGQTKHDPILKADDNGLIRLNRTFRIPTSGAMDSMAGDVVTCIPWLPCQLKIEAKSRYEKTKKDGSIIFIEHEWIRKNNKEAIIDNQIPLLAFTFKKVKQDRLWWLLKDGDLQHLIQKVSFDCHARHWRRESGIHIGHLNKKKDKTKLIHKELLALNDNIHLLTIDNEHYALLRHKDFETLMKTHKRNDEKFKRQAAVIAKRRRVGYVQDK